MDGIGGGVADLLASEDPHKAERPTKDLPSRWEDTVLAHSRGRGVVTYCCSSKRQQLADVDERRVS